MLHLIKYYTEENKHEIRYNQENYNKTKKKK